MPKRIPTHRPFGSLSPRESQRQYNKLGRDKELLKLYSGSPWKKFRAMIRAERVLCEDCQAIGLTVLGKHVHHLVDPRDDQSLMLSEENVRLLCVACHNREHKTRRRP